MNMIKKTALTATAIAAISLATLGASASDAEAGWKKKKHFHFYGKHHSFNYGHGYYCKPKYRKIWVWSPRHGHKIKRWVKVGKWCGGRYISLY